MRRDSVHELQEVLKRMERDGTGVPDIGFDHLDGVHFARLLLLEDSEDLDRNVIPASLVWQSEIDAPLERHVDQLADVGGDGLDAVFGLCEGYPVAPTPATRAAYLRERMTESQANYVNTVGRTVDQIHGEAHLREAIEDFLGERRPDGAPEDPEEVRAEIQRFVRGDPSLAWATKRAPRPSLRWRVGEAMHATGIAAGLLVAAPIVLLLLPIYLVVLRLYERGDDAPHLRPTPEHEEELAAIEDFGAQNQFSSFAYVKPVRFRLLSGQALLWLIDYGARHIFTRGDLAGIKTIHFAHWTALDGWRRVLFTSNYDGSHESYMDDFIDKIAWALNATFSAAVGYPKTRFLFFEGAAGHELDFKDFQRCVQIPTQVWYSAYDNLTAANIDNNALIRSGLFGTLTRSDTEAWLRRF